MNPPLSDTAAERRLIPLLPSPAPAAGRGRMPLELVREVGSTRTAPRRGWLPVLALSDAAMLAVSLLLVLVTKPLGRSEAAVLVAYPLVTMAVLSWRRLYRTRRTLRFLDQTPPVLGSLSFAAMGLMAFAVLAPLPDAELIPALTLLWLTSSGLVAGGRLLATVQLKRSRRRGEQDPVLILGAGEVGHQIARLLKEQPETGLRPIGFVDDDPSQLNGLPLLGAMGDLESAVREHRVNHVVLAFSQASDESLLPLVRRCSELGVQVSVVPRLFEAMTPQLRIDTVGTLPLLELSPVDVRGWQFTVKYVADRILAAGALIMLSPLLAAVALAVKLSSPGPVFFRQRRVGLDGVPFDIVKFRSMRVGPPDPLLFEPARGHAPGGIEGTDRRTPLGRILRRTGLDELPQLVNVARGEMSLVGPRPERPEFVATFDQSVRSYGDRHRVKAGMTGLAQVNGLRGRTSLADRIEFDNYYIRSWSLGLDLKILLLTFLTPFKPFAE